MNLKQLARAAREVHDLIDAYSSDSAKKREMVQDPLLFGFFSARFGDMSRQRHIYIGRSKRPKRVDFRFGGANTVLIEFAVRPPHGGAELYGTQNRDELNKLTRFPRSTASLRVLLLFDFRRVGIAKDKLRASFANVCTSPGRYARYPVQILYVHHRGSYRFLWKP